MLWLAVAASVSMRPVSLVGQLRPVHPLGVEFRTRMRVSTLSGESGDEEARSLTKKIKRAKTAADLIAVLDGPVDDPIFNFIHGGAAFYSLARLHRRGRLPRSCAESSVVVKLQARVMIVQNQLNSHATSNVLWGIWVLTSAIPSMTELIAALAKTFALQVRGMTGQALSNCLWALAHLKDMAGVVEADVVKIVRALATKIPQKAGDMKPQELVNCLWAAGQLKDVCPDDVVKIVPDLVTQILNKAQDMNPQDMANSLQGLVLLQDLVPEVRPLLKASADSEEDSFLRSTAVKVSEMLPTLSGSNLRLAVPAVVWACARSGLRFDPLLEAVAQRFGSSAELKLTNWSVCALRWSYQTLDPDGDYDNFQEVLRAEVIKRGLSDVDVDHSKEGPVEGFGQEK